MRRTRHEQKQRSSWAWASRLALVAVATVLAAFGPAVSSLPSVQARASHDLPSPSAFRLSPSTFPSGSVIRGSRATERTIEASSGLHTVSLARLGHLLGYLQTAWWWPASRGGGQSGLASLQYTASIFSSQIGAGRAAADAEASLWELGYPLHDTVANDHPFAVTERDGHGTDYLILQRGAIELELRLRYDQAIDPHALATSLWYLEQAGRAAWKRAGQLAGALPVVATAATLPPVSTAPWGAGPVVKSPSLMVLDESHAGADTHLKPEAARPFSRHPSLASHAGRHARIVLPAGLARAVRVATRDGGGAWYDASALYWSPDEAHAAFLAVIHANRSHAWLRQYALDPAVWHAGSLSAVDETRAWRLHGETIFVLRVQNVVLVLTEFSMAAEDALTAATVQVKMVPTWLHAQGTNTLTAGGDPVVLASASWYGAEEDDFVVGGLDFQPYQAILQKIKLLGYNSIRLPISNQLVEQNPTINAHVAANPELQGMSALDILDRIVNYAGALGISIILDDHRSDAGWSTQADGLWYTKQYPESSFNADWATLAQRYAVNNVVIGADLRNEPHAKVSWGDGNVLTDWHAAAQRAGNVVLASNPHLLIIVEGIQFYKKAVSYWWGGSLMGVEDDPVVLHFADGSAARSQLVYSVHDYGPSNCGGGCPWFNKTATYASLSQTWEQYWGYVVDDPNQPYAAPIWVGEFGTCDYQRSCVIDTASGSQGQWFNSLVQYIAEKHVGWGYWSINGTQSTGGSRVYGTLDWYGFLDHTWTNPYPWLEEGLSRVLTPQPATGQGTGVG